MANIIKPDVPIGPVVDCIPCAFCRLAKHISTLLKSYQEVVVSDMGDVLDCFCILQNIALEENETK